MSNFFPSHLFIGFVHGSVIKPIPMGRSFENFTFFLHVSCVPDISVGLYQVIHDWGQKI